MISRFLNKNIAPRFRTTLVGSGLLCFLVPAAGFYKLAGLSLTHTQLAFGLGIVVGLTLQSMILFAIVALAEEIFVKRSFKSLYR